jgi:hypothetical protein
MNSPFVNLGPGSGEEVKGCWLHMVDVDVGVLIAA